MLFFRHNVARNHGSYGLCALGAFFDFGVIAMRVCRERVRGYFLRLTLFTIFLWACIVVPGALDLHVTNPAVAGSRNSSQMNQMAQEAERAREQARQQQEQMRQEAERAREQARQQQEQMRQQAQERARQLQQERASARKAARDDRDDDDDKNDKTSSNSSVSSRNEPDNKRDTVFCERARYECIGQRQQVRKKQ